MGSAKSFSLRRKEREAKTKGKILDREAEQRKQGYAWTHWVLRWGILDLATV